ncbi:Lrp/AsnC ligand binding domain-containing protein [Streptomyces sp. WAC08452]|uniref:Lrp/AsnC ligand binding domain-containing protein n=1 Tax=Streptomyces sp. WAC08452 TaxID=2487414 RepID=UPI00163CBB1F|nr:hypothetical protein [Streptomyces sp. WAC08452]
MTLLDLRDALADALDLVAVGRTERADLDERLKHARSAVPLLRIRVRDVNHLQQVIKAVRRTGKVEGTKTFIIMDTRTRATEQAGTS